MYIACYIYSYTCASYRAQYSPKCFALLLKLGLCLYICFIVILQPFQQNYLQLSIKNNCCWYVIATSVYETIKSQQHTFNYWHKTWNNLQQSKQSFNESIDLDIMHIHFRMYFKSMTGQLFKYIFSCSNLVT